MSVRIVEMIGLPTHPYAISALDNANPLVVKTIGIAIGAVVAWALFAWRLDRLREAAENMLRSGRARKLNAWGNGSIGRTGQMLDRVAKNMMQERDELLERALTDSVTSVLNRAGLQARLSTFLEPPRDIAVLSIDLEGFKPINISRGYDVGDVVLHSVAERLSQVCPNGTLIARSGGDEFMVVADLGDVQGSAEALGRRIADAIAQPIHHSRMGLSVKARVGITEGEAVCVRAAADLMSEADVALAAARRAPTSGRVRLYDAHVRAQHDRDAQIVQDAVAGLRDGAFVPYFQPQVDLRTGALIGAEVLVRWQHPELGVLAPGAFLDVIPDKALVDQIALSCREQAIQWLANNADARPEAISLNYSARDLAQSDCAEQLHSMLSKAGLTASDIMIEVLEDVMILNNDSEIGKSIDQLRTAGHEIELDDFGTGNSGLLNITSISANQIKIDRSFVSGVDHDAAVQAVFRALMQLSHDLGINVLAEGVETDAEAKTLAALGCTRMQGYLFGKPMSGQAFASWCVAHAAAMRDDDAPQSGHLDHDQPGHLRQAY